MSTSYPAVRTLTAGGAATVCVDRGCDRPASFACVYVDRGSRACRQPCCDEHGRSVAAERFCLRHAGVMDALLGDPTNILRKPDVDNRAPSLVAWIARTLATPLEAMLAELARDGEGVIPEPLRPIIADDGVGQTWRRSWQLTDGSRPRLVVGVEVDEANDESVIVTVYTEVVRRDTPPWISARRRGERLSPEEDERRRLHFYQSMLDAVAASAAKQLHLRHVAVPTLTAGA